LKEFEILFLPVCCPAEKLPAAAH